MTITSALRIFAAPTLLAALVSSARAAEPHPMSWTVGGIEREALVYAPAESPSGWFAAALRLSRPRRQHAARPPAE